MNKKIINVSILALFCWRISAQENNSQPSDFRRHEIGISFGAFSQPSIFYAGSEVLPVFYEGFKGENNKICRYNIGTFSLSYRYHFTERHSLGVVSTLLFSNIVDKYYVNDHSGVFTFWSLEPAVSPYLQTVQTLRVIFRGSRGCHVPHRQQRQTALS